MNEDRMLLDAAVSLADGMSRNAHCHGELTKPPSYFIAQAVVAIRTLEEDREVHSAVMRYLGSGQWSHRSEITSESALEVWLRDQGAEGVLDYLRGVTGVVDVDNLDARYIGVHKDMAPLGTVCGDVGNKAILRLVEVRPVPPSHVVVLLDEQQDVLSLAVSSPYPGVSTPPEKVVKALRGGGGHVSYVGRRHNYDIFVSE